MSGSLSVCKIHKMTSWEFPSAPLTTANPPNFPWKHVCHRHLSVSSRYHMFPVTLPIYETSSPFPPPLVILTFFCHCTARSLLYCCFVLLCEWDAKKKGEQKEILELISDVRKFRDKEIKSQRHRPPVRGCRTISRVQRLSEQKTEWMNEWKAMVLYAGDPCKFTPEAPIILHCFLRFESNI